MISRRELMAGAGAAIAAGLPSAAAAAQDTGRGRAGWPYDGPMHVGTQAGSAEAMLRFYQRCGVKHICGDPEQWTEDGLRRLKDRCERHGISLDMVPLGMPRSVGLTGDDDSRKRQIEQTCLQVVIAAKVGIPAIKYNLTVGDVLRSGWVAGRGGSRYNTWNLEDAVDTSLMRYGRFPADLYWERIERFLEAVIPVAATSKVRMACHPHDPGVPSEGFRGEQRVLGTVAGLKRFVETAVSPYHGLNLCVGTISSNLDKPAEEVLDVIRYFGGLGKVFNVHLRNIRGRRDRFTEVFIDEGDVDVLGVVRMLREVGYAGMVMPDHTPQHDDDEGGLQALAFDFGYIRAAIQGAYAEAAGCQEGKGSL